MPLRLSKAQAKQYGLKAKPTRLSPRERYGGYRSGWEQQYARYLGLLQSQLQVMRWQYEGIKLVLADNTTYTPDFLVELPTGALEFHEVKGRWTAAARIKFKVALEKFPMFPFVVVQKAGNRWTYERYQYGHP